MRAITPIASFSQKFFVLFGAPGVGKGTFAKLLKKDLKFNHISTGDEIRKIIKGQASKDFSQDLIKQIKDIVNAGGLVNDDIVFSILKEKLKEKESQKGVLLDGFPRTLAQLNAYDKLFPLHLTVNVTLRDDILLEKLMGRRTCFGCGASYNVCNINKDGYEMEPLPTKKDCVCDACGGKVGLRDDDKAEVIQQRMREYAQKTEPLLNEYRKKKVCIDFEVKKGVKDYPKLLETIQPYLK